MVQAQTELELGLSFASILFLFFVRVGGLVGGWVLKLKLLLTHPPSELELELGLNLALHDLDIFEIKIRIPDKNNLFATLNCAITNIFFWGGS